MKEPSDRHDMSDEMWRIIEPHLPGRKGQWGGVAEGDRLFVDAVFWVLRTGAHGATCHLRTGTGTRSSSDTAAGATTALGKASSRPSSTSPASSGS